MYKARILFRKENEASYISHLDLMRTLQRSFCRASFPVKYSEGFNPHICMSILAPLSTGFRSRYELCDVELTCDEMPENAKERLSKAVPLGITVLDMYKAETKAADMAASVYEIRTEGGDSDRMKTLFSQPLIFRKKSKSGIKEADMSRYIRDISFEKTDGGTLIKCKLSLGEDQLNPAYMVEAMRERGILPPDGAVVYARVAILGADGRFFR